MLNKFESCFQDKHVSLYYNIVLELNIREACEIDALNWVGYNSC